MAECGLKFMSMITLFWFQAIIHSLFAHMVIHDEHSQTFINISTEPWFSGNMTQFYNCMSSYNSQLCALDINNNSNIFSAIGVSQISDTRESNSSTFHCLYSMNRVNCTRMSDDCFPNGIKCGSGQFKIQWNFSAEYLKDAVQTSCRGKNNSCAAYTIAITNTTNDNTTTWSSSTGDVLNTIENISTPFYLNFTLQKNVNPEDTTTTITFTSTIYNYINTTIPVSTQSTNIIIIIVVVSVCALFILVIFIVCVCKKCFFQKEIKANETYSNIILPERNRQNYQNYNNTAMSRGSEPVLKADKTAFNENALPSDLHTSGGNEESFLQTASKYHNFVGDETSVDSYSKLFPNLTLNVDDYLPTQYSRLGDHVRIFEHVYNCSTMDSERNQETNLSHYVDLSDITLVEDDQIKPNTSAPYNYSLVVKRK